jgi:hypothetical protein
MLLCFNDTEIFTTDSPKFSNSKFHENPSSGNGVVPYGLTDEQTEADRQTDMTKLIVTFRIFANAPKNCSQERGVYVRSADGFVGVE